MLAATKHLINTECIKKMRPLDASYSPAEAQSAEKHHKGNKYDAALERWR